MPETVEGAGPDPEVGRSRTWAQGKGKEKVLSPRQGNKQDLRPKQGKEKYLRQRQDKKKYLNPRQGNEADNGAGPEAEDGPGPEAEDFVYLQLAWPPMNLSHQPWPPKPNTRKRQPVQKL